ncbi:sn-glycerol 3-phosphate transport system permease protein [Pullulanibacillus pueri]|uniref:Glycerol-3-phosphate ABC transporter permease n=1 Tax=Pullulanibacillus pueri TaxID=1437324 RepID=A0A8J2ZZ78_9BACL|nr:carbohydrate ABC transporter permease [Pullulanibacillus pueri]MBM7683895.1 sn-glycerol 3-phosphate transport system permease protein [Pullulanibacillus pueri]GGH87848.1 glycerol-3-phosphate ABC transporter permease [Pullulanibacillus pueri]
MRLALSNKIILYLLLTLSAVILFLPILFAFFMSFMGSQDALLGKILPSHWTLENYEEAFRRLPLLRFLFNSVLISLMIMIGQLIFSSLAAYAFVFLKFKGRETLFFLFVATMMIPFEASIIPNFQTIKALNLIDTYPGLALPFLATAFGTFLLRQTFKQIPIELREASEIAGKGHFKFYLTVVLPIAKSSLVTLGIYSFLSAWNMYLWPLLSTTNDQVRTVQIGLKELQSQEQVNQWGVVMAGAMVVAIPTLILLFIGQKKLQKGLAEGALK